MDDVELLLHHRRFQLGEQAHVHLVGGSQFGEEGGSQEHLHICQQFPLARVDAVHHPPDLLEVLLLLLGLVEDLQHQGFELLVDPPPHEPFTLIPLHAQQVVESLRVHQVFEDQHYQTVTVEGLEIEAQVDGDGTQAHFMDFRIFKIELTGQDAVKFGRTKWTVIPVKIVFTNHLRVAVDVDGMQTPADEHS